jgi:HEAT repeat protein
MRSAFAAVLLGLALFTVSGVGQVPRLEKDPPKVTKDIPSKDDPLPISTYGGKTISQWKLDLKHQDASRRSMAILAIMNFPDSAKAVRMLLDRLHDTDVSPRVKALLALRNVGVDAEDIPAVVSGVSARLLHSNESQAIVRYEAAVTLRRFLPWAGPAVPSLIRGTLDRSSWEIRFICVQLLARIAADQKKDADPRAITGLLDALRYETTYQVRLEILQGLGTLGRPNNPQLLARLVGDLGQYARSTNKGLAIWAYAALVSMSDEATAAKSLSAISKLLKSEDLETRTQAAEALGALGSRAKSKVPALVGMLKDRDLVAVHRACIALGRMGDTSEPVVDGLLEILAHKDPKRAMFAVKAIVDLKLKSSRVLTTLDKMLENKNLDLNLRSWIEAGLKELNKK